MGHLSLDGSKYQANASKHKAMSYQRIQETEPRLEAEIAELLRWAPRLTRRRTRNTAMMLGGMNYLKNTGQDECGWKAGQEAFAGAG